jgi:hypothetical protein
MSVLKENIRYHAILYVISPVLALIYGLRSRSWNYIRWTIFVFTSIYGSLLTYYLLGGQGEVGTKHYTSGADGARHINNVYIHYQHLDFETWFERLVAIISFSPTNYTQEEPYTHIISYLVGSVFNAPGLFFFVVAVVFAYFYSGSLVKIYQYIDWNSGYNTIYFRFFFVLFCMFFLPYEMQTVRTWTAGFVLLYAVLHYYDTRKKKYLLLALIPPLIHIGFFALALPVWFVLFTGLRTPKLYFIIFVISIFASTAIEQTNAFDFIQSTEVGQSKFDGYYVEDQELYIETRMENAESNTFYKNYERARIHFYVLTGIIFFIYFILRKKGFGKLENTLFSYALATATFSNFFIAIYAVHNRGWILAAFFILALMAIVLSKHNLRAFQPYSLKVSLPLNIFILAIIPYMLYYMSNTLRFTSANILILPIVSWIEPESSFNLRELIGIFL